jgi:hypothetical protein
MSEKQPKPVSVKTISVTGKVAVVETVDKKGVHRFSLPSAKVVDGKVDAETIEAAIPYGIPWADMPIKVFTGEELQAALYASGYWTEQDVLKRAPEIIGVLQALYRVHLGSLVEFAAKYKSEVK